MMSSQPALLRSPPPPVPQQQTPRPTQPPDRDKTPAPQESPSPPNVTQPTPAGTPTPVVVPTSEPGEKPCAGFRWPVKIADDADALSIALSSRMDITIAALRQFAAPGVSDTTARTAPVETTVYRITNVTLRFVAMQHDADYHLVISDPNGVTMIVESPDPNCALANSSTLATQIQNVRASVNRAIPKLPARPDTSVTVEGVGFFDFFSGAFGQAPNGIELHPVTAICFGVNCRL